MYKNIMNLIKDRFSNDNSLELFQPYNTQLCEALNMAVMSKAPKHKVHCLTKLFYYRVSTVAGQHNLGWSGF